MKKVLLLFAALLIGLQMPAAEKKDYKYVDASKMTIINKAQPGGSALRRLEVEKYPDLPDRVRYYLTYPTGMAVRFRTNSPVIRAIWETGDTLYHTNMPVLAQKGCDLYIKDKDGKWLFAGIANPKYKGKKHNNTIVADMDGEMHECMLYLPLFMQLNKLKIGIDPKSKIEFEKGFKRAPIVAMGSSYTHGSGVSRPGMAWPAQLSRRLGLDIANLGTSGLCKLEPFLAQIIADTDADMFIFDGFSNPSAEQIRERLPEFVRIIREKHPKTPLVFLQTYTRESGNFNLAKRKFEEDKRAAAVEEMNKLIANDPNIYFLNPGLYAGEDHETSVDGTHPSDLGVQRAVDNIEPHIKSLVKKYNIK